jgi:3-phenylpropionate/cinnamic acid dioxygenase small subunit
MLIGSVPAADVDTKKWMNWFHQFAGGAGYKSRVNGESQRQHTHGRYYKNTLS